MNPVDDKYWAEYDGLQHAKHQLLTRYMGGWFPILSSWHGRVLYIDCHAGRGRHLTGHEGSPVLALRLLLEHSHRTRILSSTDVHFFFFEIDQRNYRELCSELASFGQLPSKVHVHAHQEDYESHLRAAIAGLQAAGHRMAPSFAFIDPYGFMISMDFLNRLLAFPACELLINFMYRYIDMAIRNPAQSANMDALFGCSDWRRLAQIGDSDVRARETIALFSRQLSAEYATHLHMTGDNNALKYVLIHATNHQKGRTLMKDAIWAVAPDGTFRAHERNTPEQLVLLIPEPDLDPLEQALQSSFAGRTVRMEELYEWLVPRVYLQKHLHLVLKNMRRKGRVQFNDYTGRFAFSKNPRASFAATVP